MHDPRKHLFSFLGSIASTVIIHLIAFVVTHAAKEFWHLAGHLVAVIAWQYVAH